MKLTTGYDFQGYFITEYIDVIFDEMIVGIGFGKGFLASIDNSIATLTGGEATTMIEKLNTIKAELRKRVIEKAQRAGANALLGIDFESSRLGDLMMVSMTATAVKIDKIVDQLPLTEGKRLEQIRAEQARLEEERKKQQEAERREKIARGEIIPADKKTLMEDLNGMETVEEMLSAVKEALETDPGLLTDEQLQKLETYKEMARLYGTRAAVNSFRRALATFWG